MNTDDNMRLELRAPRTLYRDNIDSILAAMREHRPDVVSQLSDMSSEAWVRSELAASYFTSGDLDAALEHAKRSVALDASFEGQKLLGQILQQLGPEQRGPRRARRRPRCRRRRRGTPVRRSDAAIPRESDGLVAAQGAMGVAVAATSFHSSSRLA